MLSRARAIATGVVVALVVALLVVSLAPKLIEPTPPDLKSDLIAAPGDFTISSTITDSSNGNGTAFLYPGVQRYLVYTVQNNMSRPIKVTSLSITGVTSPAGCAASSNLDTSQTSYSAPTATALLVGPSPATNSVVVPIMLKNTSVDQKPGCENKTFGFTYTGTAYPQYATTTTLTSSPNPSVSPQSVTFTATVTPSPAPPSAPTGSVKFFRCTTAACSSTVLLGTSSVSASGTNAKATVSATTLPGGNNFIQAVYQGDENFSTSASSTLTQLVYSSCITGNQNTNLTVASGQFICVTSQGKLNGTATIQSGGALYVTGGTVNNNVTVNAGGGLFVEAGSSINGSITATSPTNLSLCGAKKINGPVAVSGSPNIVIIGDGTAGCAGNDINGNVTVSSNTAGYKVVGNNVSGTITVTSNSGAGVVGNNNKVSGNLACTGNSPAPTNGGQPNNVKGTRSGQCATL